MDGMGIHHHLICQVTVNIIIIGGRHWVIMLVSAACLETERSTTKSLRTTHFQVKHLTRSGFFLHIPVIQRSLAFLQGSYTCLLWTEPWCLGWRSFHRRRKHSLVRHGSRRWAKSSLHLNGQLLRLVGHQIFVQWVKLNCTTTCWIRQQHIICWIFWSYICICRTKKIH